MPARIPTIGQIEDEIRRRTGTTTGLKDVLDELAAIKRDLATLISSRPRLECLDPRDSEAMISCHEADQLFRLTNGTAISDAKAKLIPSSIRRSRGRACYYVNIVDARHRWGAGSVVRR